MTKAEEFIKEANGMYKDVPVLIRMDEIANYWNRYFGVNEEVVVIRPKRNCDDIGNGCGMMAFITFNT